RPDEPVAVDGVELELLRGARAAEEASTADGERQNVVSMDLVTAGEQVEVGGRKLHDFDGRRKVSPLVLGFDSAQDLYREVDPVVGIHHHRGAEAALAVGDQERLK